MLISVGLCCSGPKARAAWAAVAVGVVLCALGTSQATIEHLDHPASKVSGLEGSPMVNLQQFEYPPLLQSPVLLLADARTQQPASGWDAWVGLTDSATLDALSAGALCYEQNSCDAYAEHQSLPLEFVGWLRRYVRISWPAAWFCFFGTLGYPGEGPFGSSDSPIVGADVCDYVSIGS